MIHEKPYVVIFNRTPIARVVNGAEGLRVVGKHWERSSSSYGRYRVRRLLTINSLVKTIANHRERHPEGK